MQDFSVTCFEKSLLSNCKKTAYKDSQFLISRNDYHIANFVLQ